MYVNEKLNCLAEVRFDFIFLYLTKACRSIALEHVVRVID